jgi:hypothetical protein
MTTRLILHRFAQRVALRNQTAKRLAVNKLTSKQKLFPRWEMPSDPVKAVWWFMHWLLKVLVRFFWLPIIAMTVYEIIDGVRGGDIQGAVVSGLVTLVIGVGIWVVLYVVLQLVNIWVKISQAISDANQVQQNMFNSTFSYPYRRNDTNGKVVEGSIEEIKNEEQKQQ